MSIKRLDGAAKFDPSPLLIDRQFFGDPGMIVKIAATRRWQ